MQHLVTSTNRASASGRDIGPTKTLAPDVRSYSSTDRRWRSPTCEAELLELAKSTFLVRANSSGGSTRCSCRAEALLGLLPPTASCAISRKIFEACKRERAGANRANRGDLRSCGWQIESPDATSGRIACESALSLSDFPRGQIGVGAGATTGKTAGTELSVRGGIGIGRTEWSAGSVTAICVVNAFGDVVDPVTGSPVLSAPTQPDTRLWLL